MEENFLSKKEEQKSIPSIYVDTNNKNNLHTTNNTLYKTRQTYSKRINTTNMKKLTKIFSRDVAIKFGIFINKGINRADLFGTFA